MYSPLQRIVMKKSCGEGVNQNARDIIHQYSFLLTVYFTNQISFFFFYHFSHCLRSKLMTLIPRVKVGIMWLLFWTNHIVPFPLVVDIASGVWPVMVLHGFGQGSLNKIIQVSVLFNSGHLLNPIKVLKNCMCTFTLYFFFIVWISSNGCHQNSLHFLHDRI